MRTRRLILLNGMPGIGKSTLAERFAGGSSGTVVLDVDRIRRAMPGYPTAPVEAARGRALATAQADLADGHDVVMPQLVARLDQLVRFEAVARAGGARFVHVLLVDAGSDPVARFHRRGGDQRGGAVRRGGADPWHMEVREAVAREGGDDALGRYRTGLDAVLAARPDVVVVRSVEGDPDGTWAALDEALAPT